MDRFLKPITSEVETLVNAGRSTEAIYALQETISWLLVHLGLIYSKDLSGMRRAEECVREALKVKPGAWEFHLNLAHLFNIAGKFEEAKNEALKAVVFSDGRAYEPFYNLGVICQNLIEHDRAIEFYQSAIAVAGNDKNLAGYNISSSLLATEQWEEGWRTYENRLHLFDKIKGAYGRFAEHYNRDTAVSGKTVYVYSEQGIGDLIQFSRYLPLLKKKGAKVILESQASCAKLMEETYKVDVVARPDSVWPVVPNGVDYGLSICSLPGIFGAGIEEIPNKPYIKQPKRKKPDFLKTDKFKIGICWAGNADHQNDSRRSMFLKDMSPLFNLENCQLFSLQSKWNPNRVWSGRHVNLVDGSPPSYILDLAPYLNDFRDTAYCIGEMDLIISVDTSVAHLSAAMGRPTWILIDQNNDWRWGLKGNGSRWYPSARLFRQERIGDWRSVVEDVVKELDAFRTQLSDQNRSRVCDKTGSQKPRSRKHSR